MVSPRIWVSCTVADDSQQEMALAQRLIGDLQKAGAYIVTDNASIPDTQFLSFLQQELSRCQWFLLVQTPQTKNSRRAQMAIQEALQWINGGSLRGALVTWSSADDWDMPASWSKMKSNAYNGDYPRLRDKLLLDLNLLRIEGIPEEGPDDVTVRKFPPSRRAPISFPPIAQGENLVSSSKRSKAWYKTPISLRLPALHLPTFDLSALLARLPRVGDMSLRRKQEMRSGDRPAARPLFSVSSPRFWIYSIVSVSCIILIILAIVLTSFTHNTPITSNHLTLPRPVPTQPSSSLSLITVQDAGHVFITTGIAPVFDQAGKPLAARCSAQKTATVPAGVNVVAMDNNAFQVAGQTYLHVAYPDPCILGLDYSSNAALANGTGAVGWVAMNALAGTRVVRPQPEFKGGAIWRDCWTPSLCASVGYPNVSDTLVSKDAVLLAWNTGSYWDVHWWHVLDKGGKEASVYGRDWGAYSQ